MTPFIRKSSQSDLENELGWDFRSSGTDLFSICQLRVFPVFFHGAHHARHYQVVHPVSETVNGFLYSRVVSLAAAFHGFELEDFGKDGIGDIHEHGRNVYFLDGNAIENPARSKRVYRISSTGSDRSSCRSIGYSV